MEKCKFSIIVKLELIKLIHFISARCLKNFVLFTFCMILIEIRQFRDVHAFLFRISVICKMSVTPRQLDIEIEKLKQIFYPQISKKWTDSRTSLRVYWSILITFMNNKKIQFIPKNLFTKINSLLILRYYATFKVKKIQLLFYKINTCLQKLPLALDCKQSKYSQ